MFAEFGDTGLGLFAAGFVFEAEWQGDNGHHKDVLGVLIVKFDAFGYLGNDGSRTGAGTTAHTGGDEEHLGVVGDGIADVVGFVEGGLTRTFGFVACTETKVAQRNLVRDWAGIESLHIGVADDKIDTVDTLAVHVVDSVSAATANADNFDVR